MKWIDSLNYPILIAAAILLGLAPFRPEPHLLEKLRMLSHGDLVKPIDIFDLAMHSAPLILLLLKLFREKFVLPTQNK